MSSDMHTVPHVDPNDEPRFTEAEMSSIARVLAMLEKERRHLVADLSTGLIVCSAWAELAGVIRDHLG